ncbi:MAG: DUF4365 domain-containing protein [Planctomycetota bacterium]|jgi:hypothetical protein
MNQNILQENLSRAMFDAAVAQAGFSSVDNHQDQGRCIDVIVKEEGRAWWNSDGSAAQGLFLVQLKSTSNLQYWKHDSLHYPLDIKTYDQLRHGPCIVDIYLVVVLTPPERDDWIVFDPSMITLKHGAWTCDLYRSDENTNTSSTTLELNARLDRETLAFWMQQASNPEHRRTRIESADIGLCHDADKDFK